MSLGWILFDSTVCFYEYGIVMLLLVRKLGFSVGRFRFVLLGYAAVAGADTVFYWLGLHHTAFFFILGCVFLYAVFVFGSTLRRRIIWGCIGCGLIAASLNLTIAAFTWGWARDVSGFVFPSYTRFIILVGNLLVLTFLYFILSNTGQRKAASNPPFRIAMVSVFAFVLIASLQMSNLYMVYGTGGPAGSGLSENLVLLAAVLITIFLAIMFFFEYTGYLAYNKKQAELELEHQKWESAFLAQAYMTYHALSAWKHDYQNHMEVLFSFLKNKKYQEMEEYLAQMNAEIGPSMQIYYTGNSVVDAVLSNKLFLAKTRGVRVSAVAVMPGKLTISDVQLGSILANLLDNAIEAQESVAESFINVSVRRERGMMQIKVENSASGGYVYKRDHLVSSKKGKEHGLGLETVQNIIDKAGGIMDIHPEADRFTVKILLPVNAESEVS